MPDIQLKTGILLYINFKQIKSKPVYFIFRLEKDKKV